MKTRLSCTATGLVLASLLPSQSNAKSTWMFPVHTQTADPIGGEYGTWAAGPDYKVSFHDGFSYYPVLGPSHPENLPLAWRDTRVSVGDHDLVAPGETARHGQAPWRFEYRYENVTEAYDVREDGVEQTFVIAKKPVQHGDLVVRGRIATKLRCEPVERVHGALTFRDEQGEAIVSYGAAFAVDASGAKFAMSTSYVGGEVALTLAAASLPNATFPLTVDPLTTTVLIATGNTLQEPEIGRDDIANQLCFAYSRLSSAADYDCFVRITANDYSAPTLIYTDVTASWSTRNNQVAFVGGSADKWIVVFQRDFATSSAVRFVVSPSGSTANIANVYSVPVGGSTTHRNPDVGGLYSQAGSGSHALVVYQSDATVTNANTSSTEVHGLRIDLAAAAPVLGTAFLLDSSGVGAVYDRERPSVNQVRGDATQSWIVAWQEFNNTIAGDDWDVEVARISSAGAHVQSLYLGNDSAADHGITPRVEGSQGRYLVAFATVVNAQTKYGSTYGTQIECQRFDWSEAAALPTEQSPRVVAASEALINYAIGNVAYDTVTDSHWAVTYTRYDGHGLGTSSVMANRCGFTGGTVEAAVAHLGSAAGNGYSPSVTFDDDLGEFKLVFTTTEANGPLQARSLRYAANAAAVPYGTSCGGSIGSTRAPNAGDQYWAVTLGLARPNTAGALLISGAQANLPLDSIGMIGCVANVDLGAGFGTSINVLTTGSGSAALTLPLPDSPAPAIGDVFLQWVYFDPGANAANLVATSGLRVQIR